MSQKRIVAAVAIVIAALTVLPAQALAFTCTGFPTFDELARRAENVWVVRALEQGVPATTIAGADPVAYVNVEIVRVVKGRRVAGRVRLWDALFGSDCPAGFTPLRAGRLAVVIVRQASIPEEHEFWSLLEDRPARDAYFVDGGCGPSWHLVANDAETRQLRAR
ncbi:MAG: hypothetical protein AB7I50_16090 [Vicinamibacterales bacterium]